MLFNFISLFLSLFMEVEVYWIHCMGETSRMAKEGLSAGRQWWGAVVQGAVKRKGNYWDFFGTCAWL